MSSIQNRPAPQKPAFREAATSVAEGVFEVRDQANIFAGWEDGFIGAMTRDYGESHLEAAARLLKRSGIHAAKGLTPDLTVINLAGSVGEGESALKTAQFTGVGAVVDVLEAIPQGAVAITQVLAAAWHLAAAPFESTAA